MIFSRRTALLALVVCPLIFGQSDTQASHPNFSGRWRMDKGRSDFASAVMPDAIVRVIDQHETTLNIHTIQTTGTATKSADVSYFIDGSPSTNIINNREATSKTFWDGPALNVRTLLKLPSGDNEVIEDRYELSDDGKTLITTSHISTPKGGIVMKLVCEKEQT
jgi:hypothetical protein